MAKELPYFKFEPSAWDTGSIQLCTFEHQGIFINICSMYWQRLGELPYKLALQKVCGGNATALKSLCDEHVLSVVDGMICIDFLNEQLSEFDNLSKTNSQNALSGWKKRRKDATALRPQSERNAIRGEEIREEKRREDNKNTPLNGFEFYADGTDAFEDIKADERFVEGLVRTVKNGGNKFATEISVMKAVRYFISKEATKPEFNAKDRKEVKQYLVNWIGKNALTLDQYGK